MLVDDETVVLNYLTQALALRGVPVITFENGDKAVEYFLKAHSEGTQPKTIVVDDMLVGSGISGLGIIRKVREVSDDTVIVLISGGDPEEKIRLAAGLRVDKFMQKPIIGQRLIEEILMAKARREGSPIADAVKSVTGQMGGSWFTNRELAVYAINLIILITIVWFVARMDAQLTFLTRKIEIVEQNLNNESGTRSMSFNVLDGSIKEVKGALGQINKGK